MDILPLYFLVIFIILLFLAFKEYSGEYIDPRILYTICFIQIILIGFRKDVGPDYGSYKGIFSYSYIYDYSTIFLSNIPFSNSPKLGIEWLYILMNKVVLDLGLPFYVVTLLVAIISLTLVYKFLIKNSDYPTLLLLLGFIPGMLISTGGQMRQSVAGGIMFYSFIFIKERKLFKYFICVFLAAGFHTSAWATLPLYWLVRIPMNKFLIFFLVLGSMILSPFRIYEQLGVFLNFIAGGSSISDGVNGYMDEQYARINGGFGIPEVLMALYTCFILYFNDELEEKSPYYEYYRNVTIIGICAFFILRENPILSSRLVGVFMGFVMLLMGNALSVVSKMERRFIFSGLIFIIFFNFCVFSVFNAKKANYSIDTYYNFILP
ncbi:EpsG family protein [Chryseobacterium joostei]|uniref:EpsG family protein n=1 Tax=Chryseobacterium joostei TaxID=112234 RepID=A0A1N7JLI7_9FLAO|nr:MULTISPECIES: EpsG family protein [Chryseobacterium]AZB00472.1 EpsG family protein [Chryseobacterium joostei]SIS50167.1 transmembrane protein EpsG [Chryseobacterium joostei]HCM32904.1 EpsG family protein [Chryseobacterium sp.]